MNSFSGTLAGIHKCLSTYNRRFERVLFPILFVKKYFNNSAIQIFFVSIIEKTTSPKVPLIYTQALKNRQILTFLLIFWASMGFGQQYNDVSLQQSASPSIASVNDTIVFSIQLFNEGKTDLTGLSVQSQLPNSVSYLSHTTNPNTTYDPNTGLWQIGSELTQYVISISLKIKALAIEEGVVYNAAQVHTLNEIDVDSEPANDFLLEDDMAAACVTIPHQICTLMGESVTLEAPSGYAGYEWYFDDGNGAVLVSNEASYIATQPGKYTFSVLGSSCPEVSCCPVILEENCSVNQPPVASWDGAATSLDTPVDIDVLGNDSDPDDGIDLSSITVTDPPINGTAIVNPDGTITYVPDPGFSGQDTLIYEICDNGQPPPVLCDTALVVIMVDDAYFDLALEKTLSPNQPEIVDIGDDVSYLLTVTNEGDLAASDIELADHIPAGLALSPNNTGWTLNAEGNAIYIISDLLQPGQSLTVEIILTVVYGGSGEAIVNIGEITGAIGEHGNVSHDVDSTPDNGNDDEDDQDGQTIELSPHDPTGYIYCDKTGLIITGGTISVDGPGDVFITQDGSAGYYEFFTDGTPGVYDLTYNHPDGLILSEQCLPQQGAFDPTGLGSEVILGVSSDQTNTYLSDTTCAANPYYLSFELEAGDPPIFKNNLPFQCNYIGSFVCQDEGNGQLDGNEPALEGIVVNLFNCTDTLNPLMVTVTNINGNYAFDGLPSGDYLVQFELPPDSRFTEGIPIDENGFSDCITLEFGECDTTTFACVLTCPTVDAGPDLEICVGEQIQIQAFMPYGNGDITWSPAVGLSDPNVLDPLANPFVSTTYTVIYDDGLGCSATDSVHINVTTNCLVDLIEEDSVTVQANCEHGDPLYCFDVPYEELSNFSFELNGQPYDAEFGPCDFLRERFYALGALAALGDREFKLDHWIVDGQVHTASFQNVGELVGLLNGWDPMGNWVLDPITFSLEGGLHQSYYTSLMIADLQDGTIYDFTLYQFFAPNSSYVILPKGEHELIITRLDDGITDTVYIKAACVTPEYIELTMPVGSIDTICFDLSELDGEIAAIFNPCLDGSGNPTEFELMTDIACVEVFSMFPGETETCYVVCDETGVCDTTYIFVTVYDEDFHLLPDSLCTPKDIPIVGEILLNDQINSEVVSLQITIPPNHGTVQVNLDNTITYTPDEGYCNDDQDEPLDQFTYEICTPFDCESTTVTVQVKCDGLIVYNGFSPNGDGINDYFKIEGLEAYDDHKLMVFNRWGNKVFQSEDYRNDWSGFWDTKRLPNGTYFYVIELNGGETWLSGYLQIWW